MTKFLAIVMLTLGITFAPAPAHAKATGWDCNAYNVDPGLVFRYCRQTCDQYAIDYWVRVKLYQYDPAQGGIVYKFKNGTVAEIGSGVNNGSFVNWDENNWSLYWKRMATYNCSGPTS